MVYDVWKEWFKSRLSLFLDFYLKVFFPPFTVTVTPRFFCSQQFSLTEFERGVASRDVTAYLFLGNAHGP